VGAARSKNLHFSQENVTSGKIRSRIRNDTCRNGICCGCAWWKKDSICEFSHFYCL